MKKLKKWFVLLFVMITVAFPSTVFASNYDRFINDSRWANGTQWGWGYRQRINTGYFITYFECIGYVADFTAFNYWIPDPESGEEFYNPSEIRDGDIIQLDGHYFVVLKRTGNQLYTAEGNYLEKVRITWDGYWISGNTLYGMGKSFIKGYHFESANAPKGMIEKIAGENGCLHVKGWCFDKDGVNADTTVVACIGGDFTDNGNIEDWEIMPGIMDNNVNETYGVTGSHRFNALIKTNKKGKVPVYVYVLNAGGGKQELIYSGTIDLNRIAAQSVSLDQDVLDLTGPSTARLTATVLPDNAADKSITWDSENPEIASVDQNGNVTAKGIGSTVIEARTENDLTAYCEVTVKDIPAESIALDRNEITFDGETSIFLNATVYPEQRLSQKVSWSSSNPEVATVNCFGQVVAEGNGTTTIEAKTDNGKSAFCTVKVNQVVPHTETDVANDAIFYNADSRRIYGLDRYETANLSADALNIAKGVEKFDNVIVASGNNYPDALSGGYLAKVKNAPVLLVKGSKEKEIANKIKSILKSDGTVYILGGPNAVSQAFENRLNNSIFNITRLWGEDRYSTNMEILKAAGVSNEDLLICSGTGYADSLSASAAGKPILLVGEALTPEQKTYLEGIAPQTLYAIGGTKVVSDSVMNQIGTTFGKSYQRVSGEDRYATSVAVANTFCPNPKAVLLTYAFNYPDGLSGGPLAMALESPILLVTSDRYSEALNYKNNKGVEHTLVLGGPGLISDGVVNLFK